MEIINYVQRPATTDEFIRLRQSVGWSCPDRESITLGLKNAIFSVCAEKDNEIIGYGRIIGDAAFAIYIQDIIVIPEEQRKGIGMGIMTEIMKYIKANYSSGTMVCLMAAKGKENFTRNLTLSKDPMSYLEQECFNFSNK